MESIKKYIPSHPLLRQKIAAIVFWRRSADEITSSIFLPNNICGFGFTLSGDLLVKNTSDFQIMPQYGTRNTLNKPSEIKTQDDFFNVSLRLVIPNGLSLFTKIPMDRIYEEDAISLTDVFKPIEIVLLGEKLAEAKTDELRVALIENFLMTKITCNAPVVFEFMIEAIHRANGHITVQQLAKQFDISERTIHRYFNKYIGVNPNEYINLIRFRSVLALTENSSDSILNHALDVGYYDQSHFIKHFKEFSSVTPKQFFELKNSNSLSDFYNI
jgi:AraC-like DNA-binding protein